MNLFNIYKQTRGLSPDRIFNPRSSPSQVRGIHPPTTHTNWQQNNNTTSCNLSTHVIDKGALASSNQMKLIVPDHPVQYHRIIYSAYALSWKEKRKKMTMMMMMIKQSVTIKPKNSNLDRNVWKINQNISPIPVRGNVIGPLLYCALLSLPCQVVSETNYKVCLYPVSNGLMCLSSRWHWFVVGKNNN